MGRPTAVERCGAAVEYRQKVHETSRGYTQDAASYEHGSQWSNLADRDGFAVLYLEQSRSNNMNLCFNWFEPGDTRRGDGEPLSIYQMIQAMIKRFSRDETEVFITGLSAGGAMTSVVLATYPELFSAGAIVAGLPYGTASGVLEALERMRGAGGPQGKALADLIPQPAKERMIWPAISIWHGSADVTVAPSNTRAAIEQWQSVHGLPEQPDYADTIDGHMHRAWIGQELTC